MVKSTYCAYCVKLKITNTVEQLCTYFNGHWQRYILKWIAYLSFLIVSSNLHLKRFVMSNWKRSENKSNVSLCNSILRLNRTHFLYFVHTNLITYRHVLMYATYYHMSTSLSKRRTPTELTFPQTTFKYLYN